MSLKKRVDAMEMFFDEHMIEMPHDSYLLQMGVKPR